MGRALRNRSFCASVSQRDPSPGSTRRRAAPACPWGRGGARSPHRNSLDARAPEPPGGIGPRTVLLPLVFLGHRRQPSGASFTCTYSHQQPGQNDHLKRLGDFAASH